jgi:methyl-accepting chemotaxis protein
LIAEIAAAGKEQATGIDQISQAVGQMDKVTQTNAANAEETAAASEELNAQAEQLQGCVRDLQALVGLQQTAEQRAAPPTRLRQHTDTKSHSVSRASAPKSTSRELIPLESAQETRSDFSEFSKAA